MIIVCTGNEADKSSLKKVKKIVISTYYQDMEGKRIAVLNQFLPSMKLHHKFIEGDIDKKMFYKKYSKNILENEELYATLILLMQLYAKEKDLCFVCHEDEMEVGYMKFLCDILEKIFNIEYCSYKKWKKKGKKLGKCRINIEKLNKETKKYRDILFGDEYPKKKKNKKKKKNDKKRKKNKNKIIMDEYISVDYKPKKKKKKVYDKDGYVIAEEKDRLKIVHIRKLD